MLRKRYSKIKDRESTRDLHRGWLWVVICLARASNSKLKLNNWQAMFDRWNKCCHLITSDMGLQNRKDLMFTYDIPRSMSWQRMLRACHQLAPPAPSKPAAQNTMSCCLGIDWHGTIKRSQWLKQINLAIFQKEAILFYV